MKKPHILLPCAVSLSVPTQRHMAVVQGILARQGSLEKPHMLPPCALALSVPAQRYVPHTQGVIRLTGQLDKAPRAAALCNVPVSTCTISHATVHESHGQIRLWGSLRNARMLLDCAMSLSVLSTLQAPPENSAP